MRLIINNKIQKEILSYIRNLLPKEFCAFFYGKVVDDIIYIERIKPIKNYASSGRFFLLKKNEVSKSIDHVAFFHSHNKGDLNISRLDKKCYHDIADIWILGKVSSEELILKAYNQDYEIIDIKL